MEAKNIWITGATSGIGRECVIQFARAGYNVFASARNEEKLNELKHLMSGEGFEISILPCDVRLQENITKCESLITERGGVDILLNAAGITSFRTALSNSIVEINRIIETNLLGAIYLIKSVLPKMVEKKDGAIVNILSVVNFKVFTRSTVYAASKSGLQGYTESLREEIRKDNIRVINVYPGATDTSIWSDEVRKQHSVRMMKSEEVAKSILWAVSEKGNVVVEDLVLRPILGDL